MHIVSLFQLNISLNVDFVAGRPRKVHGSAISQFAAFSQLQSPGGFRTLRFSVFSLEILAGFGG